MTESANSAECLHEQVFIYRFPVTICMGAHSKDEAERNIESWIAIKNMGEGINGHQLTVVKDVVEDTRSCCNCEHMDYIPFPLAEPCNKCRNGYSLKWQPVRRSK